MGDFDLTPVAYGLAVVALLVGYAVGRVQEAVLDWLRDALGMAVSALVYLLVAAGAFAVVAAGVYLALR